MFNPNPACRLIRSDCIGRDSLLGHALPHRQERLARARAVAKVGAGGKTGAERVSAKGERREADAERERAQPAAQAETCVSFE